MKFRNSLLAVLCTMCLGLTGCDFGEVEQGRCVGYNQEKMEFTMVLDVKHDAKNPSYTGGVVTYKMPADPTNMGEDPVPGGRVIFDIAKKQIDLFIDGEIKYVPIEIVSEIDVTPANPVAKNRKFPEIDKANGTVTEYSKRLSKIYTFKVPAEYLDLPASTWEAGDECRIYKKNGEVLRFMNVTRTNIFKK